MMMVQTSAQFTVSANSRYLLKDGQPFFWLGDTGWELFHRLNTVEAAMYFKRRSEQGFTVVQAVVLAELDGLHTPNTNGDIPLMNDDPARPNEKYFNFIDSVIDLAAGFNISIALLPTWGDKVFKNTWGTGPEIFSEQNAAVYAQWLANRYKDKKNIIWVLGGDRNPRNEHDVKIWRAMGRSIKKATGGRAVIGFHPQPNNTGSAEWFHNDDWLSFNMFQTGHCRDAAVYDRMQSAYRLKPVKPVMDAEPIYEDHPVCFNVKELGTSNSLDVRRAAYLDLFAGAFGHTYGCHGIWQMYAPGRIPVNAPGKYWYDAMELPGANQLKYLRTLMEAFPVKERMPDQTIITTPNTVAAERIQATRGTDYLMVYTTTGNSFTVNMGKITGSTLKGFWHNPRNGEKTTVAPVANKGSKKFSPPTNGYGNDWVLVLFNQDSPFEKQ